MKENIVYVIQEIPGTKTGSPKINIIGAGKYGKFKFLRFFSEILYKKNHNLFFRRRHEAG